MNQYDNAIVGAICADTFQRECRRTYGPTPQQQREEEARQKAWAFEHGDHQIDGSVKHGPPKMGEQLTQYLSKPVITGSDYTQADKLGEMGYVSNAGSAANHIFTPSPAVQTAMRVMEQGFAQQGKQLVQQQNIKLTSGEILVLQFNLAISSEDRAKIDENPGGMRHVVEQLQRELAYQLGCEFDIEVSLPE